MFASSLPHILNLPKALKVHLVWQALVRSCSVRELGQMRNEECQVHVCLPPSLPAKKGKLAPTDVWIMDLVNFPPGWGDGSYSCAPGRFATGNRSSQGSGRPSLVGQERRHGPRTDQ